MAPIGATSRNHFVGMVHRKRVTSYFYSSLSLIFSLIAHSLVFQAITVSTLKVWSVLPSIMSTYTVFQSLTRKIRGWRPSKAISCS